MDDTYTLLKSLVNAVMVKDATSRTLFSATRAYEEAADEFFRNENPSSHAVSEMAFEARFDAYLAEDSATKVQAAAYEAAIAYIRATEAAKQAPWLPQTQGK